MNLESTGRIEEIFETKKVTATFQKREFVVEMGDNPQYPEIVSFQFVQDKCDILDGYKVGDNVTVSFNLKGRKWVSPQNETKYFNTLQAWKISKGEAQQPEPPQGNEPQQPLDESDLPF